MKEENFDTLRSSPEVKITFNCLKSATKTPEKCVKYVQG